MANNERVIKVTIVGDASSLQKTTTVAVSGIGDLEKKLGSLAKSVGNLNVIGKVFIAFEGVKNLFQAFGDVGQFNIDMLRMTQILGGDAEAASVWTVAAHEMGIEIGQVQKGFTKLSKAVTAEADPSLHLMGIATRDAHGALIPLGQVLGEVADWFHKHAGEANNATLANNLFGRSGYQLLPILQQGRAGLEAIKEEAKKYGLVLDQDTIQRNAAFTFSLKETGLALHGLQISLMNAALPGIAALGQALSRVIADNLPMFIGMVNRAVSYIIGLIEGFTGLTLTVGQGATALSDLGSLVDDSGQGMEKASGSADRLANAIQRIRDRTDAATRAIDKQIASLREQKAEQDFVDQQAKLQQDLANKEKDIVKLRQEQWLQFYLGNYQNAQNIGDEITKAEQDQADLRKQSERGVQDEQTRLRIDALEAQKKAVQDAADKQIAAMQKAAKDTSAAMVGTINTLPAAFGKAGKLAGLSFAKDMGAEQIGKTIGKQLMDAIAGPEVWVDGDRKIQGHYERRGGDWKKVGEAIGNAFGTGFATAMGATVMNAIRVSLSSGIHQVGDRMLQIANTLNNIPGFNMAMPGLVGIMKAEAFVLRQFHEGGIVKGRRGQEVPALLRVGEQVLTEEQQRGVQAFAADPGVDLTETNDLLRDVIMAVRDLVQGGGGNMAGVEAKLFNAIDGVTRNRGRGIVGARA